VDPSPDLEARRLFVSAALTTHAARSLGGRVAAGSDARDLLALARGLDAEHIARVHRLSFDPPYPGVTAGPESVRGGLRLLLACRASGRDEEPFGVVFTTLIPGRAPQVSVAPVRTPIPEGWLPLGELL
jgi:hypothetical protein